VSLPPPPAVLYFFAHPPSSVPCPGTRSPCEHVQFHFPFFDVHPVSFGCLPFRHDPQAHRKSATPLHPANSSRSPGLTNVAHPFLIFFFVAFFFFFFVLSSLDYRFFNHFLPRCQDSTSALRTSTQIASSLLCNFRSLFILILFRISLQLRRTPLHFFLIAL